MLFDDASSRRINDHLIYHQAQKDLVASKLAEHQKRWGAQKQTIDKVKLEVNKYPKFDYSCLPKPCNNLVVLYCHNGGNQFNQKLTDLFAYIFSSPICTLILMKRMMTLRTQGWP